MAKHMKHLTKGISTLVIIFVHYVARSYCETIKLPNKCLKSF
jgi:hypothetical protein